MLRRIISRFDPSAPPPDARLLSLVISDYVAYYSPTSTRRRWELRTTNRAHSPAELALLFLPRMLTNPCLHATAMMRIALGGPRFLHGVWRTILIAKHSIDIQPNIEIGPGLVLPHPVGIILGWGLRIGRNVTLLQDVSLGLAIPSPPGDTKLSPTLEDDVIVFGGAWIFGPVTVGRGSVVGAGGFVEEDVAPDSVCPGRAAVFRELRASREARKRREASAVDQEAAEA